MLEDGRLHAAEMGREADIRAQSLEAALTAQEQYVLAKFDEVVRIADDTYKNRNGNSELTPEMKLAIAEQAAESSLRPVVETQLALIAHVAERRASSRLSSETALTLPYGSSNSARLGGKSGQIQCMPPHRTKL
jgi:hypothetical protein